MPAPQRPADQPTLFLRLFLSHLLLLFTAFVSTMLVFEYLFEPGIKYFLLHRPSIVIPVVLGLIGIAGVLSAWTAGAIAEPIDEIIEALESGDPAGEMHLYRGPYTTEEHAALIHAIRRYQATLLSAEHKKRVHESRARSTQTLIVTVAASGVILSANVAAEVFTGYSRQELLYGAFSAYFTSGGPEAEAFFKLLANGADIDGLRLEATDMSGNRRAIAWTSMPVYDTAGTRTGTMLFGVPSRSR